MALTLNSGLALAMVLASNGGRIITMLKIILGLLSALPVLEQDLQGVINEIKDAPDGTSAVRNGIAALRKLADDLEAAL